MQFQIISTESSKSEFLEKFVANNFASSDRMQKKKNFMAPFCGWGSTVSRLEPL